MIFSQFNSSASTLESQPGPVSALIKKFQSDIIENDKNQAICDLKIRRSSVHVALTSKIQDENKEKDSQNAIKEPQEKCESKMNSRIERNDQMQETLNRFKNLGVNIITRKYLILFLEKYARS